MRAVCAFGHTERPADRNLFPQQIETDHALPTQAVGGEDRARAVPQQPL